MTAESDVASKIIQNAVDALNRGDRQNAKRLAEQAASLSPGSISPWLILAALASPSESLAYVEKALLIDPESKAAREAFAWALKRQNLQPMEPKPEPPRDRIVPAVLPESSKEMFPQAFESKPKPSLEPIHQPIEPKPEPSQERISLPVIPVFIISKVS